MSPKWIGSHRYNGNYTSGKSSFKISGLGSLVVDGYGLDSAVYLSEAGSFEFPAFFIVKPVVDFSCFLTFVSSNLCRFKLKLVSNLSVTFLSLSFVTFSDFRFEITTIS